MKNRKKLFIAVAIIIVLIIISAIIIFSSNSNEPQETDIVKATALDLSQTISVTGNIEANAREEITLPTQQKVIEIYVEEGRQVKSGDPILKIDAAEYEYQLKKYELTLELANTNLQRLMNTTSLSDKRVLENAVKQAQINLANAEANYNEAKRKLDQNQALYEIGAVSKEEYQALEKSAKDYKNNMELMQIQLDNAGNTLKDFDQNNNDQIKEQKNQVESVKADIANIKKKIKDSTITSSINGTVVRLDVSENQYPTVENNIIKIYDLSSYKVKVNISQYDAASVETGQKATIKLKGIEKEYTGTVTATGKAAVINVEGTSKEPRLEIEITIDNPDDRIKVGFEADADITLKESPQSVAVSYEAVLEDDDGKKYIYVVEEDKAVKRYVTTGLETDFDIQITEGLKEGEQYVKNPPSSLKDGDPVRQSGGKSSADKS